VLRGYYEKMGRLIEVDGNRSPEAVFAELTAVLDRAVTGDPMAEGAGLG